MCYNRNTKKLLHNFSSSSSSKSILAKLFKKMKQKYETKRAKDNDFFRRINYIQTPVNLLTTSQRIDQFKTPNKKLPKCSNRRVVSSDTI